MTSPILLEVDPTGSHGRISPIQEMVSKEGCVAIRCTESFQRARTLNGSTWLRGSPNVICKAFGKVPEQD